VQVYLTFIEKQCIKNNHHDDDDKLSSIVVESGTNTTEIRSARVRKLTPDEDSCLAQQDVGCGFFRWKLERMGCL